ncbi:MAG: chloramphenicol acetyltransferase [Solirubrobacterales bacterium]|nr:chloramphenicol acetyltransferase [Solirubrobacterales bacterium]
MKGRRRRKISNAVRRRLPFIAWTPLLPPGLTLGRHTYGPVDFEKTFPMYTEGARVEVGAFCSISGEARVLGGGEHVISRASTFPLKARLFDPAEKTAADSVDKGPTVIGNDVYIGVGAIVLSGVTIGDGAVVGAGAVVSKSIPPYAVVVGNPGRIVRYRFESDVRERLLALRWWEWDDSEIHALLPWFMDDVDAFLDEAERRRSAP